jgi:phosphoribosylamine---glycine ligase
MNVLLIGGGGREHALAWKLTQSPMLTRLYCAPGNPGILRLAEPAPVDISDHAGVVQFCIESEIGLVVIGPEAPLVAGLPDALRAAGVAVFGPSAAAARIEASKAFAKAICVERGIPTAAFGHFTHRSNALDYARGQKTPLVVKADGLAAGKGVMVCETLEEAEDAVEACFSGAFGEAGASVVIEEKLSGEEASFFAICDGIRALPLESAQDYKRAFDGDLGPNTGGMGAVSPAPNLSPGLADEVMNRMVSPALAALRDRGTPFQGLLYAGLMIGRDGPKLIEFNARFGDPECQALMLRLKSDLLPLLVAAAKGNLEGAVPDWHAGAVVSIVMASEGYPASFRKGGIIRGIAEAEHLEGVKVFQAGTAKGSAGELLANGGRVLNVCAAGSDVSQACDRAYRGVNLINWPGGFYRRDIGWRSLQRSDSGICIRLQHP